VSSRCRQIARVLATVVAGCLLIAVAGAAEPRLEVRLKPPKFGIEDVAQLEVRVIEAPTGLSQPDLGELLNLEVVGGPSRGTEFSFINGVSTSAVTFTYLVRAVDVGSVSVGPIVVSSGDLRLEAEPITAEVVAGSVTPPRRGRSPFLVDPFEDLLPRRRSRPADVELRHLIAVGPLVVGQQVTATLVLDTTSGISGFDWLAAPSYPGWWAQRVEPPEQITPEAVEVDGVRVNRFTIARHVLIPLRAGELEVPPVRARIRVGTRSLFDVGEVLERATDVVKVRVGERPSAPEGYAGAVGQLQYSAGLGPREIDFGSSAVLEVRLEGTGNLPLVDALPVWPGCSACDAYPPEEESQIEVDERGVHGRRSWRVTVVPREWGELRFEPVVAAVFDPSAGRYRAQALGPLTLIVKPPPPTPTPTADPAMIVQPPASDAKPASESNADSAAAQWLVIVAALLAGVVVGGIVVGLLLRRRSKVIPPPRPGQSPAERARELQVALERWWLDVRARGPKPGIGDEMENLRRALEAVRFAPGRADHSETMRDLEQRFRDLVRRA
jgi:hypothetical protein